MVLQPLRSHGQAVRQVWMALQIAAFPLGDTAPLASTAFPLGDTATLAVAAFPLGDTATIP